MCSLPRAQDWQGEYGFRESDEVHDYFGRSQNDCVALDFTETLTPRTDLGPSLGDVRIVYALCARDYERMPVLGMFRTCNPAL